MLSKAASTANDTIPVPAPGRWGVAEFAALFDITPRTVRFYEDKGLLAPERENGARLFKARDYARLTEILRAKRLGFALDDIREVFEVIEGHVTSRAELLQRKANFEVVISSLHRRRKDIDAIVNELSVLCQRIGEFTANSSDDSHIFQHAAAYEARFRETMADEFALESAGQAHTS